MLGLPQDVAHALATTNAKSLVLRARTSNASCPITLLQGAFPRNSKNVQGGVLRTEAGHSKIN